MAEPMFATLHDTDPGDRFVHLGIRADVPAKPIVAVTIERLEALEEAGRLEGFDVRTWPASLRVDDEPRDRSTLDQFTRFRTWADRHGVRISPPFMIHEGSTMLGEHERVLDTPVVFAWVTTDRGIVAMAPCATGRETATVYGLLDALGAGPPAPEKRLLSA